MNCNKLVCFLFVCHVLTVFCSAQCVITSDSNPPVLLPGQTHTFVATGCTPSWSVSGPGTIDPVTGVYTAPATVEPQQQSRGVQLLANDSIFNTAIDTAPVSPYSSIWLTRVQQYRDPYGPATQGHTVYLFPEGGDGFPDTPVDNTTPTEKMKLYFNAGPPHDGILMPIPSRRTWRQQEGAANDWWNWDHHSSMVNRDTGVLSEVYNLMVDGGTADYIASDGANRTLIRFPSTTIWQVTSPRPCVLSGTSNWSGLTGEYQDCEISTLCPYSSGHLCYSLPFNSLGLPAFVGSITVSPIGPDWPGWVGLVGDCPTCTAEAATQWNNTDDAIMPGPGVDAAGLPVGPLVFHPMEIYRAVLLGKQDVGHAVRTELGQDQISSLNVWPAAGHSWSGRPIPAINSASNGNPTTLSLSAPIETSSYQPCYDQSQSTHYGYFIGCTFPVIISGMDPNGPWAGLNGHHTATAVSGDGTIITINVDTSNFGSYPGKGTLQNDWMPFGSRIRLKASFKNGQVCKTANSVAACNVVLNSLKKYGIFVADGTPTYDAWTTGQGIDEWVPQMVGDAESQIMQFFFNNSSLGGTFDRQLEIVDTSSYQVSTDPNSNRYGAAAPSQIVVTAHSQGGDASIALLLTGTAIDVFPHQLTMVSNTSWQLQPWTTGTTGNSGYTYSLAPSISGVSVSSQGLISVGNVNSLACTVITIISTVDPNATTYQQLCVVPVSPDGKIRLAFGQLTPTYTDSQGKVWYSQVNDQNWSTYLTRPFVDGAPWLFGSWHGHQSDWSSWQNPDRDLYSHSINSNEDLVVRIIVPNGNYSVTTYHEPGCVIEWTCSIAAGTNVYDLEVQGVVPTNMQNLDAFTLASGQYQGFTLTNAATVSDGMLQFGIRKRIRTSYGPSMSSALISPR